MRIEANVSIRPVGSVTQGHLVELKNLNSFRAVGALWNTRFKRQRGKSVRYGGKRAPRNPAAGTTAKEVTFRNAAKSLRRHLCLFPRARPAPSGDRLAHGWRRYGQRLPEVPDERRRRLIAQHGLSDYGRWPADRKSARWQTTFERAVAAGRSQAHLDKKRLPTITGELFRPAQCDKRGGLRRSGLSHANWSICWPLWARMSSPTNTGRHVLQAMFATGRPHTTIVTEEGWLRSATSRRCRPWYQCCATNQAAVTQYRQGKRPCCVSWWVR